MLTLVCGISAIGKSTFVKKHFNKGEVIVSPSEIRQQLTGDCFDQSRNPEVFDIVGRQIAYHLERGNNVIYDATNLTKFDRQNTLRLAKELGVSTRIFYFYVTDYDYLFMSNRWRKNPIPEKVIHRQIKIQELPSLDEADDVFIRDIYSKGEMVSV